MDRTRALRDYAQLSAEAEADAADEGWRRPEGSARGEGERGWGNQAPSYDQGWEEAAARRAREAPPPRGWQPQPRRGSESYGSGEPGAGLWGRAAGLVGAWQEQRPRRRWEEEEPSYGDAPEQRPRRYGGGNGAFRDAAAPPGREQWSPRDDVVPVQFERRPPRREGEAPRDAPPQRRWREEERRTAPPMMRGDADADDRFSRRPTQPQPPQPPQQQQQQARRPRDEWDALAGDAAPRRSNEDFGW